MSVRYDITTKNLENAGYRPLHAGDDYSHQFQALRDGVAINLTGAKLWHTIKEDSNLKDSEAKLAYDSETPGGTPNIEITNPTEGEFTIHWRDVDTAGLEGKWPYDIKLREGGAGAEIKRLARGKIEFLPNLTREIV